MKTFLEFTLILLTTSTPIICSHGGTVTFDSASDFATQFTVNGSVGNFSYVSSDGVTGGALDVVTPSTSDTVVYNTAFANSAGGDLFTSVFWRYDRSIHNTLAFRVGFTLGFADALSFPGDPSQETWGLDAGMYLYSGGNNPRLTLRLFSGINGSQVNSATLTSGNWYQTFLFYHNTGGQFSAVTLSSQTFDFGPTGTGSPLEVTGLAGTAVFSDPDVASTAQLYSGFRSQREGGVDLIDNFAAEPVPEPRLAALLALGCLILFPRRIRKKLVDPWQATSPSRKRVHI